MTRSLYFVTEDFDMFDLEDKIQNNKAGKSMYIQYFELLKRFGISSDKIQPQIQSGGFETLEEMLEARKDSDLTIRKKNAELNSIPGILAPGAFSRIKNSANK